MELADILSEDSVLACDKVKDKTELLDLLRSPAMKILRNDPGCQYRPIELLEQTWRSMFNGVIPPGFLDLSHPVRGIRQAAVGNWLVLVQGTFARIAAENL